MKLGGVAVGEEKGDGRFGRVVIGGQLAQLVQCLAQIHLRRFLRQPRSEQFHQGFAGVGVGAFNGEIDEQGLGAVAAEVGEGTVVKGSLKRAK